MGPNCTTRSIASPRRRLNSPQTRGRRSLPARPASRPSSAWPPFFRKTFRPLSRLAHGIGELTFPPRPTLRRRAPPWREALRFNHGPRPIREVLRRRLAVLPPPDGGEPPLSNAGPRKKNAVEVASEQALAWSGLPIRHHPADGLPGGLLRPLTAPTVRAEALGHSRHSGWSRHQGRLTSLQEAADPASRSRPMAISYDRRASSLAPILASSSARAPSRVGIR